MAEPEKTENRNTHNQLLTHLLSRRSAFAGDLHRPGPDDAQQTAMFTAAVRVPDHGRLAPWRFIVLGEQTRRGLEAWAEGALSVLRPDMPAEKRRRDIGEFSDVPFVTAVVSKAAEHPRIPKHEQELSAAAACLALMLAAESLGFATRWTTGWRAEYPEFRERLNLAPGETIAGLILVGTPRAMPEPRSYPAPADVVTRL
ncbi:MAG: nitroreductase family protein [Methylobacteriaceae bacterium]|nr:nitroreductase family protein [Methylobacteriaceae bacterium]